MIAILVLIGIILFNNYSYANTEVWTDFTNAKINIEQQSDVRKYQFSIEGVTPITNHIYYYAIGDGSTTPTFSTNLDQLKYDTSKQVFYSGFISSYLELGTEQYLYVYEQYLNESSNNVNKAVFIKQKLEKPEQKKYTDAFYGTIIDQDDNASKTQILFNTPWGDTTVRKIHIKIGKISSDTILKDIYNKKSDAFANLLTYAKTASTLYDNTINSNTDQYVAAGGYLSSTTSLINASDVTDDDYYFLYAVLDDENGKYVKTEGVTLSRATKISTNDFQLLFYGSENFSWKDFTNDSTNNTTNNITNTDNTIAPTTIPQTGDVTYIVGIIIAVSIAGVFMFIKYRKYKDIK